MASSGQVTLRTESVDYPCCPYGRGHSILTNTIGWTVNDNGDISFNHISSYDNVGGTWGICNSGSSYYIELVPQVNYGSGWTNLDVKRHLVTEVCGSGYTNTVAMSRSLIGQLGSYHLSGNCQLRFLYYMTVAPAPSATYPNAFPNSSYSEVSQVPVVVEVDWTAKVVYNANGGSGAPATQEKKVSGDSTTFTVSSTQPTRYKYVFKGWATSSTATTPQYQGGDTITVNKSNPTVTLYAVWEPWYRPGQMLVNNSWRSHNKEPEGRAHILKNGQWEEMLTTANKTGLEYAPVIRRNNEWKSMARIGAE